MTKSKVIDFGVLALRWYLIFYMINYGWGKITLSQFGVWDPAILEKPMKDIDSFYVAWHLFNRSVFFNVVTGLIEIIGALLLIFNRTALIGALLILTALGQIFIIDVAFTTTIHGYALPVRIAGMIISDLLILYYYKDKLMSAWKNLTGDISTKFRYKWWVFIILPIIGFLLDFVWGLIASPIKILVNWIAS